MRNVVNYTVETMTTTTLHHVYGYSIKQNTTSHSLSLVIIIINLVISSCSWL